MGNRQWVIGNRLATHSQKWDDTAHKKLDKATQR
jgi:hypothetical protein